jgi:hypothetical protein
VTIQGTRFALPRGAGRSSRGAAVKVTLHRAIDVGPYKRGQSAINALSNDVRAIIASAL